MIEVFDRKRKKVAILENAFDIVEERTINSIGYLSFSLPYEDIKKDYCKPRYYVRYEKGELYRILPTVTGYTEFGDIQYRCEHVRASLIDGVLEGEHIVGNRTYPTRQVLEYILKFQTENLWVLGRCAFTRFFEYGFTDETCLSAIVEVTRPITDKFIWRYDTSSSPFVMHLDRLDENQKPQMYIRPKKNLLKLVQTSDPTSLCTRIYPKGEGEGINQTTIEKVNNNIRYLESPKEIIDKYGLIERVWTDRRYTKPQSLYDSGLAMLQELQEPFEEYSVDFAALDEADYYDTPDIGKIVELTGFKKTFITKITTRHGEIKEHAINIANKPRDIAGTIADMQDRLKIETHYAQGATQFYQDHVYINATSTISATLRLMIPSSLAIINAIELDVVMSPFRKEFTVTGGGGGRTIEQSSTTSSGASTNNTTLGGGARKIDQIQTVSSGASSVSTTASGGVTTSGPSSSNTTEDGGYKYSTTQNGGERVRTTNSGGGDTSGSSSESTSDLGGAGDTLTETSSDVSWVAKAPNGPNGDVAIGRPFGQIEDVPYHTHMFNNYHSHRLGSHSHGMQHNHQIYSHRHEFEIPAHKHNFEMSNHSHKMEHKHDIASHVHNMPHTHSIIHTHSIPDHVHDMRHTHSIAHTHNIPNHIHDMVPGISFSGNPTSFTIFINGKKIKSVSGRNLYEDITAHLLNTQKVIPRNTINTIEILPNDNAYIMLTVSVQGFIRSVGKMVV